jgi:hypothetical protein
MYKTREDSEAAFKAQAGDDFIEFEGMNCNDWLDDDAVECEGWQVGEHRCDCGNRRVSLITEGDETTGFYTIAVAY